MGLMGAVVQLGAAGVLLGAGARKLAVPRDLRATLAALGWPGARATTAAVAAVEVAAGVALATAPASPGTQALVAGLGLAFAGAGLWALAAGRQVACACLGPGGSLGWHQLAALPLWAAAAVVPGALGSPLAGRHGATALAALALVLAGIAALDVLRRAPAKVVAR